MTSNLRLAPYHVRITGPGLDWSMTVGDADDIEVIIKVIEKMTRLIIATDSAPSAADPSKRHLLSEDGLSATVGAVASYAERGISNDPQPRYQCPVPGCPANHTGKFQVCGAVETGAPQA